MLTKIDALTGQGLMRLWGVHSWPSIDADYQMWNNAGIFALIDHGDHVDIHMAMKKGERHRCRDAVSDILNLIGNREIHAIIRIEHKQVCNLARKFDFKFDEVIVMEFLDGSIGNVIVMKRGVK